MDEISCYDYEEADIFPLQHKFLMIKVPKNELIFCSGVAAGLASILCEFVIYPIDTMKSRILSSSRRMDFTAKANCTNKFNGISINLIAGIPSALTYTFCYEYFKQFYSICFDLNIISSKNILLSSVSAQFFNCLIRNPFEVIKTQIQVGWANSVSRCIIDIYRNNGISYFYKGYWSLIMRNAPFSASMFSSYEYLKDFFRTKNNGKLKNSEILFSGVLSASFASFVTNPMDIIRCRIMAQRDNYYKNILDCFKKIYYEEGAKKFGKGLHIRTLLCSFHALAFFPMFEKIKEYLLVHYENKFVPNTFSLSEF